MTEPIYKVPSVQPPVLGGRCLDDDSEKHSSSLPIDFIVIDDIADCFYRAVRVHMTLFRLTYYAGAKLLILSDILTKLLDIRLQMLRCTVI